MISLIDLFVAILIGISLYNGYRHGLLNILSSILALSFSFPVAFSCSLALGRFLNKTLHIRLNVNNHNSWDYVLLWALTFLLAFLGLKLLSHLLTRMLGQSFLGSWNHYAGMALNGGKWLILTLLGVLLLIQIPLKPLQLSCEKSWFYKAYQKISPSIPVKNLLPERFRK
ncbi:MAG: CvpA family protein [Candidatus Margulisiibacteriota bacterium]